MGVGPPSLATARTLGYDGSAPRVEACASTVIAAGRANHTVDAEAVGCDQWGMGGRRAARAAVYVVVALVLVLAACGTDAPPPGDGGVRADGTLDTDARAVDAGRARDVTLLRDEYGVPHVIAASHAGAAYGIGYTDGEDMGEGALLLVYLGTGESTRRVGPACDTCRQADLLAQLYHLPDTVARVYDRLAPATREWLEAYAAGLDTFFRSSTSPPASYDPSDPPTGRMVAASLLYSRAAHALDQTTRSFAPGSGSNQLVLTGARTLPDTTFVVKDPHNPWQRSQRYTHVLTPELELFGNFGLGVMGCGSSGSLGFGCTRAGTTPGIRIEARVRYVGEHAAESSCPGAPIYEISDHATPGFGPLAMRCIDVAGTGVWSYDSRFGPVAAVGPDVDMDGHPDTLIVLHLFAIADAAAIDFRVAMMLADSADAFLGLFAFPIPPVDAQYHAFADRAHHIGGVLGATTPVLDPALDWTRPVSSDDARIESWTTSRDWSDLSAGRWHDVNGTPPELPHVMDPVGDFFLNCNGNPGFGTDPNGQIGTVAPTLERATGPTEREVRLFELVHGASSLGPNEVMRIMTDVRAPFVPDLVEAAQCGIVMLGLDPVALWGDGGRLLQTLIRWGDTGFAVTPDSEAATIAAILEAGVPGLVYPPPGACFTRAQLDVLGATVLRDAIAPYMRMRYGATVADPLRIPWGYLNYVVVGGREIGLPGMAVGRLVTVMPTYFVADPATGRGMPDGAHVGSALMQITSYSSRGLEIWIMPPYGQTSDVSFPSSPHVGQTIDAYVARTPRAVWLALADIETHLCPWGDDLGHEHAARRVLTMP